MYSTPDRQYTQQELADRFNCSTTTISNHTQIMSEWLDRYEGQTTYAWDADAHNPASTETLTALRQFYLVLSAGSFITGILVTLLAPFQAAVNGLIWPRLPERPFDTDE